MSLTPPQTRHVTATLTLPLCCVRRWLTNRDRDWDQDRDQDRDQDNHGTSHHHHHHHRRPGHRTNPGHGSACALGEEPRVDTNGDVNMDETSSHSIREHS
ncbi:unnamed protein product [Knipowitschia caucasica]|uniref:Uncharacterized protein n=1 Tax=Knipowitschia caucasica TaxID=637954 RepID=A0AAV2LH49_KNICA